MKKLSLILALALILGMTSLTLASCTDKNTQDTSAPSTQKEEESTDTTAADSTSTEPAEPTIVGAWLEPDPMSDEYNELWVFEDDGSTFHLYQITKDTATVKNTIDGTYEIKDAQIIITMMGYPLTYDMTLNANELVLSDHGTSATYTRYTGSISFT